MTIMGGSAVTICALWWHRQAPMHWHHNMHKRLPPGGRHDPVCPARGRLLAKANKAMHLGLVVQFVAGPQLLVLKVSIPVRVPTTTAVPWACSNKHNRFSARTETTHRCITLRLLPWIQVCTFDLKSSTHLGCVAGGRWSQWTPAAMRPATVLTTMLTTNFNNHHTHLACHPPHASRPTLAMHTSEDSRGVEAVLVGAQGSLAGRLEAVGGSDRPTPGGRHGAGCRSAAKPGDCRRLRAERGGRDVPRDSWLSRTPL